MTRLAAAALTVTSVAALDRLHLLAWVAVPFTLFWVACATTTNRPRRRPTIAPLPPRNHR